MKPKPSAVGVVCPRCGSRRCPALTTIRVGNMNVRRRRCNDCKKQFRCVETVSPAKNLTT